MRREARAAPLRRQVVDAKAQSRLPAVAVKAELLRLPAVAVKGAPHPRQAVAAKARSRLRVAGAAPERCPHEQQRIRHTALTATTPAPGVSPARVWRSLFFHPLKSLTRLPS